MGKIDLRPRLIGTGYVGTIHVGGADSSPTLSWADSQALQAIAASSHAIASSISAEAATVAAAVGWMGAEIAGAIADLERELGLRLLEQTEVLGRQLEALERIDAALRHPAKVRAAERLVDAGKLLEQRRFDRALPLAQQAISDDPLNPAAFGAAAWASIGLGRLEEAHDLFAEAAVAAQGTEHASYRRRQGRVAFALDRVEEAEQAVRTALDGDSVSPLERAACCYDLAIYSAPRDPDQAAESLRHATTFDSRYAVWALVDPLIDDHTALLNVALSTIESLKDEMDTALSRLHRSIAAAEQRLSEEIDLTLSTREDLARIFAEAKACASQRDPDDPSPTQLDDVRRRAPLQHQLRDITQVTDRLTTAIASFDEQMRSLPRIRELMAAVQGLTTDLESRKQELQRLDQQLHEEYQAAARYTQSLTNALVKYGGRKRGRKLRERDEASRHHMALSERWIDVRRRAIGTDRDPESDRISAELAQVRSELFDLNPAARYSGPTSVVQPVPLPGFMQIPVSETLEDQARREMEVDLAKQARQDPTG